jgi:hypothetical protein
VRPALHARRDEIDQDAKELVRRSAKSHIRWACGEFDHLT